MNGVELPAFVMAEREKVLAEIYEVFAGVDRQGGVSWSESMVIDNYGSYEERQKAKCLDTDTCWQDLVDDPNWESETGLGGWSFLDAIGFRYYLPAAMVRALRQSEDSGVLFHLSFPSHEKQQEWHLQKWELINEKQRLCIKHFLQLLAVIELFQLENFSARECLEAIESYWGKFLEEGESRPVEEKRPPKRHKRSKR